MKRKGLEGRQWSNQEYHSRIAPKPATGGCGHGDLLTCKTRMSHRPLDYWDCFRVSRCKHWPLSQDNKIAIPDLEQILCWGRILKRTWPGPLPQLEYMIDWVQTLYPFIEVGQLCCSVYWKKKNPSQDWALYAKIHWSISGKRPWCLSQFTLGVRRKHVCVETRREIKW